MTKIDIPDGFKGKIEEDSELTRRLGNLCVAVEEFIEINTPQQTQPFFKNYTDHGFSHINKVLKNAVSLIPDETLEILNSREIFYLVSAIIIHDIAMQIKPNVFYGLINGSNDKLERENSILDENKLWKELYEEFITKLTLPGGYADEYKREIYGTTEIKPPTIVLNWEPDPHEERIVGEFLRQYHHRYCHEVAVIGFYYPDRKEYVALFGKSNSLKKEELQIIGILARSHNTGINDLDNYLLSKFNDSNRLPGGVQIKYLMAILRLADYMEIDCERCGLNPYTYIPSKRSLLEHTKHYLVSSIEKNEESRTLKIFIGDCEDKEVKEQANFEIKKLINGLQLELNNCNRAISLMNNSVGETRYRLKFDEVVCNTLTYSDSQIEVRKVKPYKYRGYVIEEYLDKALKKYKDVNFSYKDETFENRDADLIDIYYPLTLRRIQGDTPRADITLEQTLQESNAGTELNDTKSSIFEEILDPSHQGVGFISDAGYGKTILSRALFCFFAYRTLGKDDMEIFWSELNVLKHLDFIPILFTCNPQGIRAFKSVSELIKEALAQLEIGPTHQLHNSLFTELVQLYNQKKVKLLLIIDAIDEFEEKVDRSSYDSTRNFIAFINDHLFTNTDHSVIFTKREGFMSELKENTVRYQIEELLYQQQVEIIYNLCRIRKIDNKNVPRFVEALTGEQLSRQLKRCPLTLTNSFFYYLHQNSLPDADTLEKMMIPLFFMRKRETCTEDIVGLLAEIALKIHRNGTNNAIEEQILLEVVDDFYKRNTNIQYSKTADEIINWLWRKIGILKRIVSIEKGTNIRRYGFLELKYFENLIDNYDVPEPSSQEEMKGYFDLERRKTDKPEYTNLEIFSNKDRLVKILKKYANSKVNWKYE